MCWAKDQKQRGPLCRRSSNLRYSAQNSAEKVHRAEAGAAGCARRTGSARYQRVSDMLERRSRRRARAAEHAWPSAISPTTARNPISVSSDHG